MVFGQQCVSQDLKGKLIYSNNLASEKELEGWVMEGQGEATFDEGWMQLSSPQQKSHHVYWCPEDLPASFIAEWEVKNLHPEVGLCIVFFAAEGNNGEDILTDGLKSRNGIFKQYTKGDFNNYHISYYANTPTQKDRPHTHLRKNGGFHKVHVGGQGIAPSSKEVHKIKLVKRNGHIQMFIDDKRIVNWEDNGLKYGPILGNGKLGFRQMKWTIFQYRSLMVWEILNKQKALRDYR
jgi:hypothetical protein